MLYFHLLHLLHFSTLCQPKDGEPVIESLDSEPLGVVENFLSCPKTRVDLLNPPQHFPNAVYRYCISDLTMVWNMYGGRDFGQS